MAELRIYRPEDLIPWPGLNPRTRFDAAELAELKASIEAQGIRQPVAVHLRDELPHYLVAGERRWRAAKELGADVPAMVGTYTEAEALDVALIENLQRADMSALDEGRAFARRLELGDITQEQLAEKIGKSQAYVANHVRLLALPAGIQKLIDEGVLLPSHARDYILPFANIPAKAWEALCKRAEKSLRSELSSLFGGDRLSGTAVEEAVADAAGNLSRPISREDADWNDEKPAFDAKAHESCTCGGPKYAYGYGNKKTVRCFDAKWWGAAQAAAIEAEKERERAAAAKLAKRADKTAAGEDEGVVTLTDDKFRDRYPRGTLHITTETWDRGYGTPEFFDPSELTDAKMVLVKRPWSREEVELHCVDGGAVRKARSIAKKLREQMLEERRATRREADLKRAGGSDVEPWMLRQLLHDRPATDVLLAVGRELGINVGKHGEAYDGVQKLSDQDTATLVKVLAIRGKEKRLFFNGYGSTDPIEKEVDGILKRKYGPGIRALRGSVLPSKNGKKPHAEPKPKGKKAAEPEQEKSWEEVEGMAADRVGAPLGAGVADAAQRAAEAVRASGLFNR